MKFAGIIVDISHESLDRTFQYIVPDELCDRVRPGMGVVIPFGKGNKKINGYITEITDKPEIAIERLKYIESINEKNVQIESVLISLAEYIKERYGCTMNKALKTVIPVKESIKSKEKKYLTLNVSEKEAYELYDKYSDRKNTLSRAKLILELINTDEMEYNMAISKLSVSDSVIKALCKASIIKINRTEIYRNPVGNLKQDDAKIELNIDQKYVSDRIIKSIDGGDLRPKLIFGITGSGKTEVYMEIIENTIKKGQEVIVLIPEISLTFQTIKRFYKRFGNIPTHIRL